MKRKHIAIWIAVLLTFLLLGLTVRGYGSIGQTENGGFTITLPWWQGGVELWGHPGFFACGPGTC